MLKSNPKRATSQRKYDLTNGRRPIYMTGMAVGLTYAAPDMEFRADCDYTLCRLCGALYQPEVARRVQTLEISELSRRMRQEWSIRHARTHTDTEHRQLHLSGRAFTPEALVRLAPYGVIAISDMALDDESAAAGLEAPRMPNDDAEG
jgi:hypothetical protein